MSDFTPPCGLVKNARHSIQTMSSTSTRDGKKLGWRHRSLCWLYDRLTRNDAPQQADLIFVLAGRMERKQYGLNLFRAGVAPRLLLSIGRFEVSKMRTIDFERVDELIAQRDRTRPDERHFFCEIDSSGRWIEKVRLRRWNTYGEVLALREFLEGNMPRSMIVVSTDVHLRRVALTFERVFRDRLLEVHYCPVPSRYSSLGKQEWWSRPEDRKYVLMELAKLPAYRLILGLPEWMIRRIMQLRD